MIENSDTYDHLKEQKDAMIERQEGTHRETHRILMGLLSLYDLLPNIENQYPERLEHHLRERITALEAQVQAQQAALSAIAVIHRPSDTCGCRTHEGGGICPGPQPNPLGTAIDLARAAIDSALAQTSEGKDL